MWMCVYIYTPINFYIKYVLCYIQYNYVYFTIGINEVERVGMTLDETGIYVYVQGSPEVYGGISQLYFLYYNNDIGNIGNVEFNGFVTTSPGTQPLPESM